MNLESILYIVLAHLVTLGNVVWKIKEQTYKHFKIKISFNIRE